ncbi:SiaB family protein kinase [Eisenibacter elegans]|uniref:SiaB family protein kinase n=1 Tax=Eisenibacter elegans TaxID=997 RepID=UPI0012B54FDD|nr:SiaB family protein kinase [Eisenibacter elegans]
MQMLPPFYAYYKALARQGLVIAYRGPITDVMIAELSREVRQKTAHTPKTGKKVFAVFMELTQNMLYYSAEKTYFGQDPNSIGMLFLSFDLQEGYTFGCGNLVENPYVPELVENCNIINSLDRDSLRDYKRQQRNAPQRERSRGAGIGLIQSAITADNPLDVVFTEMNERYTLFELTVKIDMLDSLEGDENQATADTD